MNKLFNTLKNVFKIDSDLSFGDSFHVTGAPRREIVASSEGVPCYVTIGSCLGDGSNQLIDGAISRNANKLLQLASDLYECVDSDDVELSQEVKLKMYYWSFALGVEESKWSNNATYGFYLIYNGLDAGKAINQLDFMRSKDLGFSKDLIYTFGFSADESSVSRQTALKQNKLLPGTGQQLLCYKSINLSLRDI